MLFRFGLADIEPGHGHAALDPTNQLEEFEVEIHGAGEFRGAGLERAQLGDLPGFASAIEWPTNGIRHAGMMAQVAMTFDRVRRADGNVCS